jgi:protein gp37
VVSDLARLLAGGTLISWADYTFNPWRGCVKISPGCRFCYAKRDTDRWGGNFWGKNAERPISKTTWRNPRKWNLQAKADQVMRRVFSGSLCDVFENRPDLVAPRQRLFDMIETTEWLIWMLLTKRPENIAELAARYAGGWPPNVWLGVSAETQRFATERIPHLVQHDVAVRFVSAEPDLALVDLTRIHAGSSGQPDMVWDVLGKRCGVPGRWQEPMSRGVDWVITGGESGIEKGIRPSHPDWYRALRDQSVGAGVAFHHKQNGMWSTLGQVENPDVARRAGWYGNPDRHVMLNAGTGERYPVAEWERRGLSDQGWEHMVRFPNKRDTGRLLDGEIWNEFPQEAFRVPA